MSYPTLVSICIFFLTNVIALYIELYLNTSIRFKYREKLFHYNFASLSSEYKYKFEQIDEGQQTIYGGMCEDIIPKYESDYEKVTDTCIYGLNSLYHISVHDPIHAADGCKYLYYLIYRDALEDKKNSDNLLAFYNELINKYKDENESDICKNYLVDVKKVKLEKAQKLIEIYDKFSNISKFNEVNDCNCAYECAELHKIQIQYCQEDYDADFCYELENFKAIYEKTVEKLNCTNGAPKTLPSAVKNNLALIILFPILIISSVPFILFSLNKFTPFVSWLGPLINRKKKGWNDLDENFPQLMQTSEFQNINGENRSYHLTYSLQNS